MHTEQNLISAEDVAQKLGIHPQTVRRLTESGKLPGTRVGKLYRYEWDAVWKAVQSGAAGYPQGEE